MSFLANVVDKLGGVPPTLEALSVAMLPDEVRRDLRRAALVRSFDRETYRECVHGIGDPLPFEELVEHPFVEAVPPAEGVYRITAAYRAELLRPLLGPDRERARAEMDFVGISRRLTRHFYRLGRDATQRGSRIEGLYHMLVVDEHLAVERFLRMYEQADRAFDLAQCRDLLNVFEERKGFLSPQAVQTWHDHERYLRARSYWAKRHQEAARFVPVRSIAAAFSDLLRSADTRILQVLGPGGMGKSMQLRRLIAYECVPRHMPCALVDFDFARPVTACREPWLLLLDLARQLQEQASGQFHQLLADYEPYAGLLRASVDVAGGAVLPGESERKRMASEVEERFIAAIRSVERPVVIVLDTCEEVVLRAGREAERLASLLLRLLDAAKDVRFVLASRNDIKDMLQGALRDAFAGVSVDFALEGFTEDEAARYLRTERDIGRADLVAALIERSLHSAPGAPDKRILPLKLALWADVVASQPDISAAELRAISDPDLEYLVNRILARLPEELRWVLRYGVIPRRLSLGFIRDVMWEDLTAAMAGTSTFDDPTRDDAAQHAGLWTTSAAVTLDPDTVWKRLRTYAGSSSWVRYQAGPPERLAFHRETVQPLRRLIRTQPFFARLHAKAADYFERLAADDEAGRTAHLREAIYHRFQAGGADVASWWRALLASVDEGALADLTGELLGPEYLDARDEPLPRADGEPLFDPLLVAEALIGRARAHLADAERTISIRRRAQLAREAELDLDRAARLPASKQVASEADLLRGRALSLQGRQSAAQEAIARSPSSRPQDDAERAEVEARSLPWLAPEARTRAALDALHAASQGLDPKADAALAARAARRLARLAMRLGRFDPAVARVREARALLGPSASKAGYLDDAVAVAIARRGCPGEAADLEVLADTRSLAAIGAATVAGRAREALQRLAALARSGDGRSDVSWFRALVLQMEGDGHAALEDPPASIGKYGQAIAAWNQLGIADSLVRAHLRTSTMHLVLTGNLRFARRQIELASHHVQEESREAYDLGVHRALLLDAEGETAAAHRAASEVLGAFEGADRPQEFALACTAALSLRPTSATARYAGLLAGALRRIDAPTARLRVLWRLRTAPALGAPSGPAWNELGDVLRASQDDLAAAEAALHPRDAFRAWMGLAHWWRISADAPATRAAVARAWAHCPGPEDETFSRVLQCAVRGDVDGVIPRDETDAFRTHFAATGLIVPNAEVALWEQAARAGSPPEAPALEALWERLHADGYATLLRSRVERLVAEAMGRAGRPVYESGWHRRADASLRRLGRPVEAPAAGAPLGSPSPQEIVLSLQSSGLCSTACAVDHGATSEHRREPAWFQDLLSADTRRSGELFSPTLLRRLVASWRDAAQELAACVFEHATLHDGEIWRLRIENDRLHALPFEAGRLVQDDTRLLYRWESVERAEFEDAARAQRMLTNMGFDLAVDGIFGGISLGKLNEFRATRGLDATDRLDPRAWRHVRAEWRTWREGQAEARTVLALTTSAYAEGRSLRGSRLLGVSFPDLYAAAGYQVSVMEDPDARALARALARYQPDIVHVESGFSDRRGLVTLDFGGEADGGTRYDPIGVTEVHQALQHASPRTGPPLIVLDAIYPAGGYELARQMCLRNYFAGSLFDLGSAGAILAAGLVHPALLEAYYQIIAEGAKEGLGTLLRQLWDLFQEHDMQTEGDEARVTGLLAILYAASERMAW